MNNFMALYTMPWIVLILVSGEDLVFESHIPVPMPLGVFVERCEHDGQDGFYIIADEVTEILVVPEV